MNIKKGGDLMKLKLSETPRYIANILIVLWIIFTILIFFWLIFSSFKSTREIYSGVWTLPQSWNLDNYIRVLTDFNMGRFMWNTILVVTISTILTVGLSAPISYSLSKIKFPGVSSLSMFLIIGLGVPIQTIFIPLYLIVNKIHLVDSIPGLILLYTVTSLPFTIYLLMGFFRTIPSSLEEAARIDGATAFQSFRMIMLPLARGGLLSAGIYVFVMLWKEFLLALVFISTESRKTISLGLYSLISRLTYTGDWGGLFAGVVLVFVPSIILYVFLARKFISGITMGIGKS